MKRTAMALALLLAGSGWCTEVAAQSAPQRPAQINRARPATQGSVDDLRAEVTRLRRELADLAQQVAAANRQIQELRAAQAPAQPQGGAR